MVLRLNLQHEFSWKTATMDFETGSIKAFEEFISFVQLHGCHFHFCQSIFRQMSLMGLKTEYMNNDFPQFAFFVRCIFALAFLNPQQIQNSFNRLVDDLERDYENAGIQYPNAIMGFVRYLHVTWISDDSKFPKDIWNVRNLHDRRSNNHVESWHALCLRSIGSGKNIWKFLNRLKKMELHTRALLQLQLAGENVSNRRLCQKKKEDNICRIMHCYYNGMYASDIAFIKTLAHLQVDFIEDDEDNIE